MNATINNQQSEGRNELRPYAVAEIVGAQIIALVSATSGKQS
jgi:hypothetical protein